MKVKKLLQALGATIFTIVFLFVWMYVDATYTHGVLTFSACAIAVIGALFIFFYSMLNDW
ncbi:hypothetical protein BI037_gp15 [Morganella phage vB_MmoP_MP2]|uniref:Uncharacterized protein n=1 Tax=Morganella phage vB_MmoP_MP2 TaxID=1852627 RepID=A0A192YB86_9CAUD|nr:hypothetical protein BI037_gp15 [Morganella phage vB_MmoP_MP2]ANM46385.1 hypothetical protein MP2_gp13B [Morganella phage vB_MmoP_MP2]